MTNASPTSPYPLYVVQVQPRARVNGMAIAAFVVAFFVSVVGIVLGYVALGQIKQTHEGGRAFALAAVIIGWIGTAVVVGLIGMFGVLRLF